ncbi:MAG: Ig-like domain-containing protein [Gemmatimonadetes bacterium]|nr:Ig-like domain-containing protein [Gemmatimonadota bacterium]
MRRGWVAGIALALAAVAACAHVEPPPGGPEDKTPPTIASTLPDSMAVVPSFTGPVVLRFSERISEQGAIEAVSVSPRTSTVQIDRGRDGIRVSLRGGWLPGTIYHVTVTPEVRDLFNNRLAAPTTLVFSTGPAIPQTLVLGGVTDRITGLPSVETRVEAVRRADSLVYAVPTDSAGAFRIAHIPTGAYVLRAYRDANRNRALDGYEPRDSAVIEVGAEKQASVPLAILDPDSTAPRVTAATASAGGRVELRFDDYLDPAQALDSTMVTIADSAGAAIVVRSVAFPEPVGPPTARAQPAAPAPNPAAAAPRAASGAAPQTAAPPPAGAALPAVGAPAAPRAGRLPSQTLALELATETPLTPGRTYQVTVQRVRNVVGLMGGGTVELTAPTPRPAPPAPPAAAPAARTP